MSEFSESFHLAGDADDAAALLERAGVRGWIIATTAEWVTFVVEGDFRGKPDQGVVRSNAGTLVHYVNAEDHGTEIAVFDGPDLVGGLSLDWNGDAPAHSTSGDPAAAVEALGSVVGRDVAAAAIEAFQSLHSFDEILGGEGNPGHRLAQHLRLPAWEWLSGHTVEFTDPEHRTGWIPAGPELLDEIRWTDVSDLPDPPTVTWAGRTGSPMLAVRPSDLVLPVVDGGWQGGGTSPRGWYWSYQAKIRGADFEEVNDELLRRARLSGFTIHVAPPHSALPNRRYSLWHRGETVVSSTVDQRGTLTDLSILSPSPAEGLDRYPAVVPDGFTPLE